MCLIEAEGEFGKNFSYTVLGNALYSQVETHAPYGGVFPNLAKREHERNLVPLLSSALSQGKALHAEENDAKNLSDMLNREPEFALELAAFLSEHARPDIDAIAVTVGPGLEPALWVGINFARALASAWDLPLVPVNHMEGHIILSAATENGLAPVEFPTLALLISGGHTELVLMREWLSYEKIGETRDDAVGEAFDKVARMLGLPYPGGARLSALAQAMREKGGDPAFRFPRPMLNQNNFDFSFSGLKTEVRRSISDTELSNEEKGHIAWAFEEAVADVLTQKTLGALEQYGARTLIVGGGVSANTYIRERLARECEESGDVKLLVPPPEYATDNALMIALAGYFRARRGEFAKNESLKADGNLALA